MRAVAVAALRTELLFSPGPKRALGVGSRAVEGLRRLLDRMNPAGVLVVGFSGATVPELNPGDLVLATSVGEIPVPDEIVRAAAAVLPGAVPGAIAQAERLLGPAAKARLGLDAVAVDMESESLAAELRGRGIPFAVVRCVLDALWEDVDAGPRLRWAGRALRCALRLGEAVRVLAPIWGW